MNRKPYKRVVAVLFAICVFVFCWEGQEVHAQEKSEKIVRVGWYQSDMLQRGEIDCLGGVSITEERKETINNVLSLDGIAIAAKIGGGAVLSGC